MSLRPPRIRHDKNKKGLDYTVELGNDNHSVAGRNPENKERFDTKLSSAIDTAPHILQSRIH
jgi:hypothetical protein